MIHEWFMHFGAIALLLALVPYFVIRRVTGPAKDKQGAATGAIFLGIAGVIMLVVALLLVCLGLSGTFAGWAGCALLSVAAGIGSSATN